MADKRHLIIAVDGPAGSGKSTVSKEMARRLGLLYLDTGAMYRALTLKAMQGKLDLRDKDALIELARSTTLDLREEGGRLKVLMDGKDVAGLIRTPELTGNVKYIAGVAGVRQEMVKLQRAIGERHGAVLEGRDIGTVVFPDADYKFYLDADPEVRARRRYLELKQAGQDVDFKDVKADANARDKSDMARSVGALKKAADAVVVDTTEFSVDQVVERLLSYIKN